MSYSNLSHPRSNSMNTSLVTLFILVIPTIQLHQRSPHSTPPKSDNSKHSFISNFASKAKNRHLAALKVPPSLHPNCIFTNSPMRSASPIELVEIRGCRHCQPISPSTRIRELLCRNSESAERILGYSTRYLASLAAIKCLRSSAVTIRER